MKKFIGGPFSPGFHEAIIAWLNETSASPIPLGGASGFEPMTEAHFARICPRHFPLSIPGDVIPGFPIITHCKRSGHRGTLN